MRIHLAGGERPGRRRWGVGRVRGQTRVPDLEACRYAFLLDKALLICKRRGDSYDLKASVNLHTFQVRDDSSGERDNKKVGSVSQIGARAAWLWGCLHVGVRERLTTCYLIFSFKNSILCVSWSQRQAQVPFLRGHPTPCFVLFFLH